MSKKKFEECTLEEATHASTATGIVYETSKYENRLRIVVEGYSVFVGTWGILNIKSLKEVKPEPIEFEATFFKYDGKWRTLYLGDNHLPYENSKKARFRCVEILEDEE